VACVQPHPPPEPRLAPSEERECAPSRVLGAGRDRRATGPGPAVVLAPVAVAAPPHLVDPTLWNLRAELRLVMDDGRLGEVVHLPTGFPEPKLEIDLLRVEEEALVEETHLGKRFAPQHECCAHYPVDLSRLVPAGLLHTEPAEGRQPEGAHERGRKAPGRVLLP